MITKQDAMQLRHGQHIHHVSLKNADGTPVRARITGKCKVWKTRPNDFRIPWKHGLYTYGEVNELNGAEWNIGYGDD